MGIMEGIASRIRCGHMKSREAAVLCDKFYDCCEANNVWI